MQRSKEEVGKDVFDRICKAWSLSDEERSKLVEKVCKGNQLVNISYVLGIYKALHTLFREPSRADSWIRRPSDYFGGRPALDVMLDDEQGLKKVRQYLDYQLT